MKTVIILLFIIMGGIQINAQPNPAGNPPVNIPCNSQNNPFCPDVSPVPIDGIELLFLLGAGLGVAFYVRKKKILKENN